MKLCNALIISLLVSLLISCNSKQMEIVYESADKNIATEINETKLYVLKKQIINADFDYSKLEDIDFDFGYFEKSKKK